MAITQTNGSSAANGGPHLAKLDASKLIITPAKTLKPIPPSEELRFGQTVTDHMLIATFDPVNGWSAPEIKPYGPLSLDPASSCFQYATNVFEGMKAYIGPDGKPRLFRPEMNIARLTRSSGRLSLPPFNEAALLTLIKKLVAQESRWIPALRGYSLYIRPTIIGTRASLGVGPSDHSILYVILAPTGPYFRTGARPVSLLAVSDSVRAWPGGTGGYKLALNYAPTFKPQAAAAELGAPMAANLDVLTPPLDGTILPGVTRDSCLALANAHPSRTILPHLPSTVRLHAQEYNLTMSELATWSAEGRLLEAFTVGTAAIVASVGRIGYQGKDIVLPEHEGGMGPVGRALFERILDIQMGKVEWEGWSEPCE
ncbi:Branched-chain-amino-acid aminotransferase, mitochondrial [Grifola frondosa]|uniref:Branched-chain-amino-acid aminotransferase, mitochondrial n=1 Tax=Grifola frondosa TaxID=5627 RepID=A0A1C7MEV9_GRIFR|nr:Branched-chain-amino-acid aminotransferase, mitochondrial [Grifola frondosa]